MKKVLLVTGRNAAGQVRKLSLGGKVHVCAIDVAALLSPALILKELLKQRLDGVDLIIVPGQVRGDVSVIEEATGVKCVKGTKHASDLQFLLDSISKIKLSSATPADELLKEKINQEVCRIISKARSGGLKIGRRMRLLPITQVIAEIPDAPMLSEKELIEKARYYVDSGADVIDLGMVSGEDNSNRIGDMFQALRGELNCPISLDSVSETEILSAADYADLILSVDYKNYGVVKSLDLPVVVIPRKADGTIPVEPKKRVLLLEKLVREVQEHCPTIADPILAPLNMGFSASLRAFMDYRMRNPSDAMMLGAGNVTELFDADSPGVNGVLAAVASELNINFVFTTEASSKTAGSVRELSTAVSMMYISKVRRQTPKDLGVSLLYLKDKVRLPEESLDLDGFEVVEAVPRRAALQDSCFRILLKDRNIIVLYYEKNKPKKTFVGASADLLCKSVCFSEKISCEHAAYLGREISKAEIALKLGKNYVQDEELF